MWQYSSQIGFGLFRIVRSHWLLTCVWIFFEFRTLRVFTTIPERSVQNKLIRRCVGSRFHVVVKGSVGSAALIISCLVAAGGGQVANVICICFLVMFNLVFFRFGKALGG